VHDLYERIVAAGRSGIYESNYLKANAPDGSGAFWLKHNVLVPAFGADFPAVAEFWAVLWRADGSPRVWKRSVDLGAVTLSSDRVEIVSESVRLDPDRAQGSLGDGEGEISWHLAMRHELPPLRHFDADWMYEAGFPRKKLVTGSPRTLFDGYFVVDGERISVDAWVGHRNHNWGTEHAHRYAYGGCNLWEDGSDLTVEGFTVQVRLAGPVRSPWLTMVNGLERGARYGAGSVAASLRSLGEVSWPEWKASVPCPDGRRARLRMRLDPARAAGLRYLHPDGTVSYCYNVKDADTRLVLGTVSYRSRAGELEFLFPDPVPGIPLHGESSVDQLRDNLVYGA